MRTIVIVSIAAGMQLVSLTAFAQDDEEEEEPQEGEGGELDQLMADDPDRPKPEAQESDEEQAPGDEAPAGDPEEMSDDERPPGDERAVDDSAADEAEPEVPVDDTAKPFSLGVLFGGGISLENGANAWGMGFGLRGGYNFGGFYVGGRFSYY